MPWYDWVLLLGIVYMFLGTDFTLNWLAGFALGNRIDKNSRNFITRWYYRMWAVDDPNARANDVDGPKGIPAPWVSCLNVTNATATCLVEIIIVYGMVTQNYDLVRPAAMAFVFRAIIELVYGSQLIWGPARARGGALANYLIIGLIPQVWIPCLVAMRFSGMGLNWLSVLLFVGLPALILLWMGIIYRNNPVPALQERTAEPEEKPA